jgi:hypothetical protein
MFLITDALNGDESTAPQPRQLSFNRARSRVNVPLDLGSIEAPLRLAKDEGQHTLLHLGKQRV